MFPMNLEEAFPEIVRARQPLAPFTSLKIGGPAEHLAEPRSVEELAGIMRWAAKEKLPVRVLGVGSNVLVRDAGVNGIVLRLISPAFSKIGVEGRKVRAGGGADLAAVIAAAAKHHLAGLETLVGISATIGGAVRVNAGDRTGEIGQYVRRVEVLDSRHAAVWREHEELSFRENRSNLDDPVILTAEFELETDRDDAIKKRMLKAWITRKANLPHSFEASARLFKNPRGLQAAQLIESSGLSKTQVGGASLSEQNANYIVAGPNTAARDVLRLIDLVRSKVREQSGVNLEQDILVW
ncbi:MAG TPA: UDP-N-acetylmuramate dehydrogenase [Gemmataceae bacterium]|nr:UDP-N-acetylmuramate dehydrogenase [Gemmataceae bacterium]